MSLNRGVRQHDKTNFYNKLSKKMNIKNRENSNIKQNSDVLHNFF